MPHERPERKDEGIPQSAESHSSFPDLKALNSSVLLLSQKVQHLVRNEKILGRNLLVLNRKFDDLKKAQPQGQPSGPVEASELEEKISSLSLQVDRLEQSVLELRESLSSLGRDFVKIEQFKELKFVIDTMNPLDFVTQKQLEEKFRKVKK